MPWRAEDKLSWIQREQMKKIDRVTHPADENNWRRGKQLAEQSIGRVQEDGREQRHQRQTLKRISNCLAKPLAANDEAEQKNEDPEDLNGSTHQYPDSRRLPGRLEKNAEQHSIKN